MRIQTWEADPHDCGRIQLIPGVGRIWSRLEAYQEVSVLFLQIFRSLYQISRIPIQTIILERRNFNSTALCVLIKSCSRLKSFQYFVSSQERGPDLKNWNTEILDVREIHKALFSGLRLWDALRAGSQVWILRRL